MVALEVSVTPQAVRPFWRAQTRRKGRFRGTRRAGRRIVPLEVAPTVGNAGVQRLRPRHRVGFKVVEKANAQGSAGGRTPPFSFGGLEGGMVFRGIGRRVLIDRGPVVRYVRTTAPDCASDRFSNDPDSP